MSSLFRYGRTNGYLSIVLIVLAVIPLIEAFFVIPQLPDTVAMAFGAGGEPTRYGSRYELFLAPGICLLLGVGMVLTGLRQAKMSSKDSNIAGELTYRRSIRSGLFIAVLLNACNIYLLAAAYFERGFSLAL